MLNPGPPCAEASASCTPRHSHLVGKVVGRNSVVGKLHGIGEDILPLFDLLDGVGRLGWVINDTGAELGVCCNRGRNRDDQRDFEKRMLHGSASCG